MRFSAKHKEENRLFIPSDIALDETGKVIQVAEIDEADQHIFYDIEEVEIFIQ